MTVVETQPAVTPIEVAEPNEAQRILLEARDLIADEKNWTKGMYRFGRVCAIGAVAQVLGWDVGGDVSAEFETYIYADFERCPVSRFLAAAAAEIRPKNLEPKPSTSSMVYTVNDCYGHAAVMRMFNRAIELAA